MSTISDVQELYCGLQGGWEKSREHIFAHSVFVFIVFVMFGAKIPEITLPSLNPADLVENGWFKFAKDTGLIFIILLIPVGLLAAYASLIRVAGRLMVGIAMAVMPPMIHTSYFDRSNIMLVEPLAILTKKDDFTFADMLSKSSDLLMRYQFQKNQAWENYQRAISNLSRNAQVYLGDFMLFFLGWNMIFSFARYSSWLRDIYPLKLKVSAVLLLLIIASWFRVSRAVSLMPRLQVSNVAIMVRADQDLTPFLDVSAEQREKVRARLYKLLDEAQKQHGPSLVGILQREVLTPLGEQVSSLFIVKQLKNVYLRGERLQYSDYNIMLSIEDWIRDYASFLFYKLINRLRLSGMTTVAYLKFIVTGSY